MNLWIRLFKVVLLFRLRPKRLTPFDTSLIYLRIWPNDLDAFGHVNNGRFLTLMDLGRLDLILRTGLLRQGLKRGWTPVLAGASIRFRKTLGLFEKVEVRTRVLGWDESWFFLEQTLYSHGDEVAMAYLRGVFVKKNKKIAVIDLLKTIGWESASPILPESLLSWIQSEESMVKEVRSGS